MHFAVPRDRALSGHDRLGSSSRRDPSRWRWRRGVLDQINNDVSSGLCQSNRLIRTSGVSWSPERFFSTCCLLAEHKSCPAVLLYKLCWHISCEAWSSFSGLSPAARPEFSPGSRTAAHGLEVAERCHVDTKFTRRRMPTAAATSRRQVLI